MKLLFNSISGLSIFISCSAFAGIGMNSWNDNIEPWDHGSVPFDPSTIFILCLIAILVYLFPSYMLWLWTAGGIAIVGFLTIFDDGCNIFNLLITFTGCCWALYWWCRFELLGSQFFSDLCNYKSKYNTIECKWRFLAKYDQKRDYSKLELIFDPFDEQSFKYELLKTRRRRAYIKISKIDGTSVQRVWYVHNLKACSDVKDFFPSYLKKWRENGYCTATFFIDPRDLSNRSKKYEEIHEKVFGG